MKKVLIIDDEQRIRDLCVRLLVQAGIVVRPAKDAREAVNIIIREDIDLILLDINMPQIDGRTIFEIIQEYNPAAKIVMSSVYPVEKQRELVPDAMDYYDKSEGSIKLLEKVINLLMATSTV